MATLTEVSLIARRGIKLGIIFLVVMMIIPVVGRRIQEWLVKRNPPPPVPPTVAYGKLPELVFPKLVDPTIPEYKLETISGGLPTGLPTQGKVYLASINRSRLMSLDRIRNQARVLGFTTNLIPLDEQNYKFAHQSMPAEAIFNIITGQFAYRFDWTTEPTIYTTVGQSPQKNQAIGEARSYFQSIGLLMPDLANGTGRARYLVATGSALSPAESYFSANFTRVDLFRADKDNMRVYTAGGDIDSPVNVLISGLGGNKRVVVANNYYSSTNDNEFATYPLKPVAAAYDELVRGGGHIAKRAGSKVTIRKVGLGYYESFEPQSFMQPIYVFEGDGEFMALVPAVDPAYVNFPPRPPATGQPGLTGPADAGQSAEGN